MSNIVQAKIVQERLGHSSIHPGMSHTDKTAQEYNLVDFRCDFAVGNSHRNSYRFIEFEDAKKRVFSVDLKELLLNGVLGLNMVLVN